MKLLTPNISQLRMLASIKAQQWMIRPDLVGEFALSALEVSDRGENFDYADYYPMRQAMAIDGNGIATVEIKGALLNSAPKIYEKLGLATTYATIIAETEQAIDGGAKGILYRVASPGGTVAGNIEASSFIANLELPTGVFCSGLACSAAYKLSAGANFILATASAEVGNIGTILSWADCTEFWKQNGIEMKAITNEGADLKSTFHTEPDETQIAFLQESINEAGAQFRAHVEAGRPNIDSEVFRAGWYSGERAESLGLIDGIGTESDAREALAKNFL